MYDEDRLETAVLTGLEVFPLSFLAITCLVVFAFGPALADTTLATGLLLTAFLVAAFGGGLAVLEALFSVVPLVALMVEAPGRDCGLAFWELVADLAEANGFDEDVRTPAPLPTDTLLDDP